MDRLLIRADASPTIGAGHVMRCLALAQAWQDAGGDAAFVSRIMTEPLRQRLDREGIACIGFTHDDDLQALRDTAAEKPTEWVVLDGYGLPAALQAELRGDDRRVLVIDDRADAGPYAAHCVLNANPAATIALYPDRADDTELLLGPAFVLLRREFLPHEPPEPRPADAPRRVLVTLGGSDQAGLLDATCRAIAQITGPALEVRVVGGEPGCSTIGAHSLTQLGPTDQMPAQMAWADVAVAAAGGTAWELAHLGVPQVALVVAGNQRPNAAALQAAGLIDAPLDAATAAAPHIAGALQRLLDDPALRRRRSELGRRFVDGRGAQRVLRAMRRPAFTLRAATRADAHRLFELANEPAIRAASFNPAPIDWHTHTKWFERRLTDPRSVIDLVCEPDGSAVGYVRFEIDDDRRVATVSVALGDAGRGRGLGAAAVRRGTQAFARLHQGRVAAVEALIRTDNPASLGTFRAAGYVDAGSTTVLEHPARRWVFPLQASR